MSARAAMVFAVFGALRLFSHWGLWDWIRGAFPAWHRRNRSPLFWGIVALLASSTVVQLAHWGCQPGSPLERSIASVLAVSMAVQFALLGAVLLLWLARGAQRLSTLAARAWAGPGAAAPTAADPSRARALGGRPMERRVLLEQAAGALAFGATSALIGWGMVRGRFDWTVVEVPVLLPRLPKALDGFTLVQISDIHVGPFLGERELAVVTDAVGQLRPDLVAITGDVVDREPRFIPIAARGLSRLRARLGVVCIPGNHDYYTGVAAVLSALRAAGIESLCNQGKLLLPDDAGGLALLGVDDLWGASSGGPGPDLAKAQAMVPEGRPTILLAHQPRYVDRIVRRGVDLQLSGHTHGGQISPSSLVTSLLVSPYVAGRYDVSGTVLYVNRGLGTVGPPARVGSPPEITKIVLVSS